MNLHSLSAVNYTLSGWLRCHFYMYQTKLLKKAMTMLDNEKQIRKDERERTLAERVPALEMSGLSLQDLQVHLSLKHFNTHFQVSINSLLLHPNDLFLPNVPRAASNYFYLQRFWGIRHFLNSNTIKVNVTEFEVHKELKKKWHLQTSPAMPLAKDNVSFRPMKTMSWIKSAAHTNSSINVACVYINCTSLCIVPDCINISRSVTFKQIGNWSLNESNMLKISVHRIFAKSYTRKLMWWTRSGMTLMLKWQKMKGR